MISPDTEKYPRYHLYGDYSTPFTDNHHVEEMAIDYVRDHFPWLMEDIEFDSEHSCFHMYSYEVWLLMEIEEMIL